MKIRLLTIDYNKDIKGKKDFLDDLIRYADIDLKLIRRAIYNMGQVQIELPESFYETTKIEDLKKNNPAEYKKVISVRKALSVLINTSIINPQEQDSLRSVKDRILKEYYMDQTNGKTIIGSKSKVRRIEYYRNYPDEIVYIDIDINLKTNQQYEGKLITMLYKYIMPLAKKVNNEKLYYHQRDYRQKDVFELIAEILNLCWRGKYNYTKIRTIFGNYKKVKPSDF